MPSNIIPTKIEESLLGEEPLTTAAPGPLLKGRRREGGGKSSQFSKAGFLWSNVVYQKGSLWHEMGKTQSDNKGSGTGQSLPVAGVVGSRTERWEVTVLLKT